MRISGILETPSGGIDIWAAQTDRPEAEVRQYADVLSADEIERASRFRAARDRNRYIVRRGILRYLLSSYLCCDPPDTPIRVDDRGKPYVPGRQDESTVQFSISHSAGLAVLAFGRGASIGVDVERISGFDSMRQVAALNFTSTEMRELENASETECVGAFFRLWTRKEAVLKASGEGLLLPADCVDVSSPGNGEKTWVTRIKAGSHARDYRLADIAAAPGFAAAAAVGGRGALIATCRRYEFSAFKNHIVANFCTTSALNCASPDENLEPFDESRSGSILVVAADPHR